MLANPAAGRIHLAVSVFMLSRLVSRTRSIRRPRAAPLFAPLTAPGFRLNCLSCGDERALPPGPPLPTARRSPHLLLTNPTRGGEKRLLPASPHTTPPFLPVVTHYHGPAGGGAAIPPAPPLPRPTPRQSLHPLLRAQHHATPPTPPCHRNPPCGTEKNPYPAS